MAVLGDGWETLEDGWVTIREILGDPGGCGGEMVRGPEGGAGDPREGLGLLVEG